MAPVGDVLCVVAVAVLGVFASSVSSTELQEYCQFDTFRASCARDEVIVMDTALYGRMNLGKCVTADLGYVGCVRDVQYLADRKCSGRRECEIGIPDEDFDRTQPCLTELKFYLEANFTCMKVTAVSPSECAVCNYGVTLKRRGSGVIASSTTEDTRCGSPDCPWIIEVDEGQRVNITLLDFGLDAVPEERDAGAAAGPLGDAVTGCRVYATIKEQSLGLSRAETICGGRRREQLVYTSKSNRVEIRIVGQKGSDKRRFALKYQAFGCPAPPVPRGGWARRSGGTRARVGCNDTGDTWNLKCVDDRWKGYYQNCTVSTGYQEKGKSVVIPSGISIVVILAVAFTIGCCIFILGLLIIKSRRRASPPRGAMDPSYAKSFYEQQQIRNENTSTMRKQYQQSIGRDRNDYAHIWEMPLPNSPTPRDLIPSDLESNRTISPYGYGYRSDLSAASSHYPIHTNGSFVACPPGKRDYQEIEEDPRYFQLDPEQPHPPGEQL